MAQQAKLTAADPAAGVAFGFVVDVSRRFVVVGAPGSGMAGSAYVFARNPNGVWVQQAKLTPVAPIAFENFGDSVAVSGTTIVVGAPGANGAYVFTRAGGVWTQQARLTSSDAQAGDAFGTAVDIVGSRALVGAAGDDGAAGSNVGSAYVFERAGTAWTQTTKLLAEDASANDQLGLAVALSEVAVAGAPGDDRGGFGAGYVFARDAGTWSQDAKVVIANPADTRFGVAVSASAESVAIASVAQLAPSPAPPPTSNGQVVVLARGAAGWLPEATLEAPDGFPLDFFGAAVSIDGDVVLAGAPGDDDGGSSAGSVYAFSRSGAGAWTLATKLAASDGEADDRLGWSVALSGGVGLAGAPFEDGAAGQGTGAAYVFVSQPADGDGDGVDDAYDNCVADANPDQADLDEDGIGDACDADDDGDGVADATDNCPTASNADQADLDGDGSGDVCDADDDGDAVADATDNCPRVSNADQADFDRDGLGDACDGDDDGDAVADGADACAATVIPEPGLRRLGKNRYALVDGDTTFDSTDTRTTFSTVDTAGCSATQIGVALGLPENQYRDGISRKVLEGWIASH